ncbi:MAG: diaminopimelate decarboxylase [Acidobacteriota bacterium]
MGAGSPFHYRDGELWCEEVPLHAVAEAVGTPCYVYSAQGITSNYQVCAAALRPLDCLVCYAVKANSNLAVLRLLRELGSGFDIVSRGELHRLRLVDAAPDRILFSGVGKTDEELEEAITSGLRALVVESESELERLAELSQGRPVNLSLRINPEVPVATHRYIATGYTGHKFGIDRNHLDSLLGILRRHPHLPLIGVGFHLGSQILEVAPYAAALENARELADRLRASGFPITFLDIGGGFGISYAGEPAFDLAALARTLAPLRSDYQLVAEPGRYIVGNAGVLLTRLIHWKSNHGKHFAVVDAAMNDLIRPALYQAKHRIVPVAQRSAELTADVVGPICETADFLAHDCPLPRLGRGDLLAVLDAGAYGFVASSNYNARPRAAEVMVQGDRLRVVRRRESLDDLVRGEEA